MSYPNPRPCSCLSHKAGARACRSSTETGQEFGGNKPQQFSSRSSADAFLQGRLLPALPILLGKSALGWTISNFQGQKEKGEKATGGRSPLSCRKYKVAVEDAHGRDPSLNLQAEARWRGGAFLQEWRATATSSWCLFLPPSLPSTRVYHVISHTPL